MSGAEMTGIHRLPAGMEAAVRDLVRPALVIADPETMTSQPEPALRFSSMNALAHGGDSLYTKFANPVSRMSALRGAELIAGSLDQGWSAGRRLDALAGGSILCGYAIDSALFAIHHVICQTLGDSESAGVPTPRPTPRFFPGRWHSWFPVPPRQLAALAKAIGVESDQIESRIFELGGRPPGLGASGAERQRGSNQALQAILVRPELSFAPRPPDRGELERLVTSAW